MSAGSTSDPVRTFTGLATRRLTSHAERLLLPVLISTSDEIKDVAQVADPVRARRLSDHEGRALTQIVRRGRGSSIRVRRATIIMASSSGTPVAAIARLVAADEDTVRDVIHAFNERGLAALDPQWAGGRPRQISDEDIAFIITTATTRPGALGVPKRPCTCLRSPGASAEARQNRGPSEQGEKRRQGVDAGREQTLGQRPHHLTMLTPPRSER